MSKGSTVDLSVLQEGPSSADLEESGEREAPSSRLRYRRCSPALSIELCDVDPLIWDTFELWLGAMKPGRRDVVALRLALLLDGSGASIIPLEEGTRASGDLLQVHEYAYADFDADDPHARTPDLRYGLESVRYVKYDVPDDAQVRTCGVFQFRVEATAHLLEAAGRQSLAAALRRRTICSYADLEAFAASALPRVLEHLTGLATDVEPLTRVGTAWGGLLPGIDSRAYRGLALIRGARAACARLSKTHDVTDEGSEFDTSAALFACDAKHDLFANLIALEEAAAGVLVRSPLEERIFAFEAIDSHATSLLASLLAAECFGTREPLSPRRRFAASARGAVGTDAPA